ncbi:tRNA (5-methylaminomethyl-2-thiouridine)(34)-methyltransferase MnmD [Flavobacterium sp. Sd200]|uniref:tRNA (5-methylaminomethyl-2-thiouridine)(34)-methyltransferase MnmD n=1 Tax=Flavobacterium sp. Sd200 TaxID=2692211 RepID=UPI001371557F|nr:tRNA (5-methylaminomethyl-2-thiouridine)(34)-methyltransferase MnmD [Flavobacterium sp. Sd200]MXN89804.1 tRNA (5-methylaminomethyl-2-thiouridine)(34)-methyltransferase MnmD [Flavobacterium sp. Sd200]
MKREIIITEDGSVTIYLPEMQETYHSKFGAIQEAQHVFIKNGLHLKPNEQLSILEIGFGTGLNAFITFLESVGTGQKIDYVGVEAYPVEQEHSALLNYAEQLKATQYLDVFNFMHSADWGNEVKLNLNFRLTKRKQFFEDINDSNIFDLVYFDAFGYQYQPHLWSEEIFKKMYNALKPGGILVTYACRSVIKNNMKAAGFTTQKLAGPPGKREMLMATKT